MASGTLTLANEQEVVRKAGRQAISSFLDGHNCFSVLRASGKVVVFDTRIPIQLAFYALVEHGTCLNAISFRWSARLIAMEETCKKSVSISPDGHSTGVFLLRVTYGVS